MNATATCTDASRRLPTFREDARRHNLWRDPLHRIAEKVMHRMRASTNRHAVMVTPGGGIVIAEMTRFPADMRDGNTSRLVGVYAKDVAENQIIDDLHSWAKEHGVTVVLDDGPMARAA